VPLQQPTAEHFSNFDDHSSNLIGNLQLDAEGELPRRMGATSRANSVRFDETANHGHWAHASRSSLDLIPRTGSGMGGHLMSERSYSHKSVGGQSSTGHSVHSATSGRANSLTGYGMNATEPPGLAPGLFILGSVPAIIRCWLTTTFKHDTMLYAAVCSGSYASYLDLRLINRLGFQDQITTTHDDTRKIRLSMYLPEAIPVSASSRPSSPAPQLPSLDVEFTVVANHEGADSKAIQIFLGSDMLRAHNADILLSSNQLTLYDDDRCKLRVPLVRPEDEHTFKSLYITSGEQNLEWSQTEAEKSSFVPATANATQDPASLQHPSNMPPHANGSVAATSSDDGSTGRRSLEQRPRLGVSTRSGSRDGQDSSPASAARSAPPAAIWNNWRRDTEKPSSLDWANVGKTPPASNQRRDTGIKVLKPLKSGTRTLSTSISQSSSPAAGQSRFFDDGRQREADESDGHAPPQLKRTVSGDKSRENTPALTKTRSANPVGGASAFAWLKSGGGK
jgi:ubiquitin carboxyl-terminal hydrolase 4/11/15